MKEVKIQIQIPDNCELVKDGDSYVVREMKQNPPRSWEEFCAKYLIKAGEIRIKITDRERDVCTSKNCRISKQEAEAFYYADRDEVMTDWGHYKSNLVLSFPTKEMAVDFLSCFIDLCKTAKNLL